MKIYIHAAVFWIYLTQNGICSLLNNDFLTIDNYKLSDPPLAEMSSNNWSPIRCSILCNQMENCKSISVRKDETSCRIYGVSAFSIGSTPVYDDDWQTLGKKGRYYYRKAIT